MGKKIAVAPGQLSLWDEPRPEKEIIGGYVIDRWVEDRTDIDVYAKCSERDDDD